MAAYATTAAISAETASWQAAAEQLASQVLELAGFQEGPIDAFQLARKLGYHVIYDQKQAGRGRLKQIAGRTTIFLRPQDRPERMHWALCHEVGETLVWRLLNRSTPILATSRPGCANRPPTFWLHACCFPNRVLLSRAGQPGRFTRVEATVSHSQF